MERWASSNNPRQRRSKKQGSLRARVLYCAIAGLAAAPAVHAANLSQLQAEIRNLSVQLDQLKAAQAQQAVTKKSKRSNSPDQSPSRKRPAWSLPR